MGLVSVCLFGGFRDCYGGERETGKKRVYLALTGDSKHSRT